MKITELYKLYIKFYKVDIDTRQIRKNSIFFSLKGKNFDGNKFVEEALEKGASFCIVDDKKYIYNDKCILVDDTLCTLQRLANYHRRKLKTTIIGITGSNGKTTTKELINSVLSKEKKTVATIGNLNNHIGVPLTLLSIKPKTEIAIVEMGANNHNEIAFLSKIIEPDMGLITNFGKAHIQGFGSLEGVIKAKSELYEYLTENNKIIFVNPKDETQLKKTKKSKRILFNETIKFSDVNPYVKLSYNNIIIESNLVGVYNYVNIAYAITIGNYFNISLNNIKCAIEKYIPQNNRSQIIKKDKKTIILDAYNANPTSMRAAIENINLIDTNNRMLILGDMLELGKISNNEHQEIVNLIEKYKFKTVLLVGKYFFKTKSYYKKFETFNELKNYIKSIEIKENTILIKGSRKIALERILEFI